MLKSGWSQTARWRSSLHHTIYLSRKRSIGTERAFAVATANVRTHSHMSVWKRHPLGVVGERATAIQVKYARKLKSICPNAAFSPTHPDCRSTIHTCSSCSLRVTEYSGCLAPSEQRQSYRTDLEALCSKKGRSQRTPKQNPIHEHVYLNRIVSADDTEDPRRIRRPFRIVDAIGAE